MTEGLEQAIRLCDALGDIFCLTLVRGLDARGALTRMGACPETFADRDLGAMYDRQTSFDAGYPRMAGAVALDGWTAIVEPYGFACSGPLLGIVSRGTEAVSVLRHDYASPHFAYAVDGTDLIAFDPWWMGDVWGADPGRFGDHLHAVGLDPFDPDDDDVDGPEDGVARAVLLAAVVTGVTPPLEALTAPMLSAQFEDWFTGARPSGGALWSDPTSPDPDTAALVAAVDAATPDAKRAVAVAEVRRIAGILHVADAPGLAEALADAEAGRFPGVSITSAFGTEVRGWLRLAATSANSLNGPGRHRLTEAERHRGTLFGWFTHALHGALYPDPDIAVRTALYPLSRGPRPLADPARPAAILARLRS